jgi:hypothetical protein
MLYIAEKLNDKLQQWEPEKAFYIESLINEIILLADQDAADLLRSRAVEQEVLDILDEA